MASLVGGGPPTMGQDMPWSPNGGGMPGRRKPTGRRRPPYIPGFDPGSRGNEPEIYTGRGGGPSAPGMGGGFGMPGMGGGGMSMPGMGGMSGGFGGTGRTSGYDDRYSGGDGGWNPRPGDRKSGPPSGGGSGGFNDNPMPDMGGGGSDDDRVYRGPSGSSQSAGGGFGNQGSTGFGGAGWSDMTPTLGGGMGGGTTPNNPPPVGQPPTMNTPTGGMPPRGGPPTGFGQGPGVRYPSPGADAAREKSRQSNTGGINMRDEVYGTPGSPTTPPVNGSYQFNNTGGGVKPTIPWGGNTYNSSRNIYQGGTSNYNMTQQGDQINQGQSMKRLANRRRAVAAKAPQQRKTIGSTVNQNLQVMRPGMRYS